MLNTEVIVTSLLKELDGCDAKKLEYLEVAKYLMRIDDAVERLAYYPRPAVETLTNSVRLQSYQKMYRKELEDTRGGKLIHPLDVLAEKLINNPEEADEELVTMPIENLVSTLIDLHAFPKIHNPKYDDLRELVGDVIFDFMGTASKADIVTLIKESAKYADEYNGQQGMLDILYECLAEFADDKPS